jgi:hypothetical protein
MYEHHGHRVLSRPQFVARLFRHAGAVAVLVLASLGVGVLGYMQLAGLTWIDAFLNAAMLLGGMGPVAELHSDAAKLFAGVYALYSGLVFIACAGILVAPIAHRMLHRFGADKS